MGDDAILQGRRVLVVEDDAVIALMVEDMLAELGCNVVGPAGTLAAALALADAAGTIDAAFLDVNLAGRSVYPVADALRARGVPLVFCTGYEAGDLREIDRGCPVLRKPYRAYDLELALGAALGVGLG